MSAMPKKWSDRMLENQALTVVDAMSEEIRELRAALEGHQGVAVPAGWCIVPEAAPDTIVVAIEDEIDKQLYASGSTPADMVRQDGGDVWAAAIAAAPQPPAVKEAEPAPATLSDEQRRDLELAAATMEVFSIGTCGATIRALLAAAPVGGA